MRVGEWQMRSGDKGREAQIMSGEKGREVLMMGLLFDEGMYYISQQGNGKRQRKTTGQDIGTKRKTSGQIERNKCI